MAKIGWIDFSTADRNKVKQILSLIRPEGQLDELGVGYLRDALADVLLPGISTIQTRAKYFFIVPYILRDYLRLPASQRRKQAPRSYLKEQEHQVKNLLREKYGQQGNSGVIGITLPPGKYIVRTPSEIYWRGLQLFGCIDSHGLSRENYLRNAINHQALERAENDEEADDKESNHEDVFCINVPTNPDWRIDLSLDLTKTEADFLYAQIRNTNNVKLQQSLLPTLFGDNKLIELFMKAKSFQDFVRKSQSCDLPTFLKHKLILAFNFAEIMEGVHLLYNHLLQLHFYSQNYDDHWQTEWIKWKTALYDKMINPGDFCIQDVFEYAFVRRINTELFITRWWQLLKESTAMLPTPAMINIISMQETGAKGKKARLKKPASSNDDVRPSPVRVGLELFQYRFYHAQRIVTDIYNSLKF